MSEKPRRGIIVLSRIIRQGRQRIAELEVALREIITITSDVCENDIDDIGQAVILARRIARRALKEVEE